MVPTSTGINRRVTYLKVYAVDNGSLVQWCCNGTYLDTQSRSMNIRGAQGVFTDTLEVREDPPLRKTYY